MVDPCHRDLLQCQNNGKCAVNISLNTTYCQCDPCYDGNLCENIVWKQTQFDTAYVYLIIFIIGLCFSVLNNSLCLELFIRCRKLRHTNSDIYLIVYSILSLLSSILLVVYRAVSYYQKQLIPDENQYQIFYCYVAKIGYNMLYYLCIWFSSCVAFERGLVICFHGRMNASRWRSFVTIIVIFATAGGSATPLLVYKCDWNHVPNLQIARVFFTWFYIATGLTIYVLATLLILKSFADRIRRYGVDNDSFIRTFLKLLYTHLFIFIPPIVYCVCFIPYTIVINLKNPKQSYFQCGISTAEYIIKVLIEILTGVPGVITWLLFVYPSKVYMTEFYLQTWSGQRLANILIFFKSNDDPKKNARLPTKNFTNNERDNRELPCAN